MKLDHARYQYRCADGTLYVDDLQTDDSAAIGFYDLRKSILHISFSQPTMVYPGLTPAVMSEKLGVPVSGIVLGYMLPGAST